MSEQWRLLLTGGNTAFVNMAVDRAILVAHSEGKVPPTVRFYHWIPPRFLSGTFKALPMRLTSTRVKNSVLTTFEESPVEVLCFMRKN